MKISTIGLIGGGRISKIFLQGFYNKWITFESIKVFEPIAENFKKLAKIYPDIEKTEKIDEVAKQGIVILAVHPPLILETLEKIKNSVNEKTVVVSLAPKITLAKMASVLPTKKLVRMIPNATSFINKGFNPLTFHLEMEQKNQIQIKRFFKPLGKTFETEENKLESYAIASAMLPTYFWFQFYEIERIASETGLTVKEARKSVKSTLKRAIDLYYDSDLTPAEVMDLIPVKPIGRHETEIMDMYEVSLIELWGKIKS
jgi:pyrroline-5-carboxylate reductase